MLCDVCHIREARNHVNLFVEGAKQISHVCNMCLRSRATTSVQALIAKVTENCEFCGAPGECCVADSFANMLGEEQRFHVFCHQCHDEYMQYEQSACSSIPSAIPLGELAKIIKRFRSDAAAHMKVAISSRKGNG